MKVWLRFPFRSSPVPLWTWPFVRICLINAAICFTLQMLVTAFPLYLGSLSFSSGQIGLIAGGYTICELVMRL